jgi:very-short-patch-repair endonuclease
MGGTVTPCLHHECMRYADVDAEVARLARRQHGVFSRTQALGAGLSRTMIEVRRSRGAWIDLAPCVYALPSSPFTWMRQCMAATLGEQRAVVSGRAAAALHGIPGFRPGRLEITVPRGSNHRSSLADIRQSDLVESTRVERIPVVTQAQTLIEIARYLPEDRLALVLDACHAADRRVLAAVRDRFVDLARTRWPGIGRVRAVLAERDDGFVPAESELERRLWLVLGRMRDRPEMIRQGHLPWRERLSERVDVLIPEWRAIIEADGRRWHTRVRDFEVDRERDNQAVVHGYRPLRFTWTQIVQRPYHVLATVGGLRNLAGLPEDRSGNPTSARRSAA